MARIAFVTGATGFLGQNLIEALQRQHWHIIAMHRPSSNIKALQARGIQCVPADLHDADSIAAAMPPSVDAIFHVAANTTTWSPQHTAQWQDNVIGTQAMCDAALQRSARRFVFVSSIAAYGLRDDVIDENSPATGADAPIQYYRSKAAAEVIVRAAIARGLPAVIVNPSHIIGPYDSHNWSRAFRLINRGALPGIPPGAGSFCYAPRVADALIAAAERGQIGHNYLLGGCNASFFELVQRVGVLLNKKVPKRALPAWLMRGVGRANDLLSRITQNEPDITYEGALIVCSRAQIDSNKARAELDYVPATLDEMLPPTLAWLQQKGLL